MAMDDMDGKTLLETLVVFTTVIYNGTCDCEINEYCCIGCRKLRDFSTGQILK